MLLIRTVALLRLTAGSAALRWAARALRHYGQITRTTNDMCGVRSPGIEGLQYFGVVVAAKLRECPWPLTHLAGVLQLGKVSVMHVIL